MKDIPLSSYFYCAQCELSNALDNLDSVLFRFDDDSVKALVDDVSNDIQSAIYKLDNFSL